MERASALWGTSAPSFLRGTKANLANFVWQSVERDKWLIASAQCEHERSDMTAINAQRDGPSVGPSHTSVLCEATPLLRNKEHRLFTVFYPLFVPFSTNFWSHTEQKEKSLKTPEDCDEDMLRQTRSHIDMHVHAHMYTHAYTRARTGMCTHAHTNTWSHLHYAFMQLDIQHHILKHFRSSALFNSTQQCLMHIHGHACTRAHIHTNTRAHRHKHTHTNTWPHTHTRTCTRAQTNSHKHMTTHVHTHTHTVKILLSPVTQGGRWHEGKQKILNYAAWPKCWHTPSISFFASGGKNVKKMLSLQFREERERKGWEIFLIFNWPMFSPVIGVPVIIEH